ncbi:hypothetical protein OKW33_006310 [Paraburkholderia atlantica]|uniref:Uncharacterized protein n=1 Tax=Paraburkholderia atlantica TaxID=2654982 RepID=A0A6I1Q1Y8_PARAM|nr:hypothetical protein [Paraburkholderia atlantica]MBB5428791.1 hypothetical protein [Paraburkholderia atlantica]MPW08325.1 hypothetical protein [Paraburkholderia atlantica]NUY34504.1 hypothetical protein [Paraburkholderia atlantica]
MILVDSGGIQEVQLAKLLFEDGHYRYFNTSEQLISYLKLKPDQKFQLYAVDSGMTLYDRGDPNQSLYGYDAGDVFCGEEVWYDSNTGKVKTISPGDRTWGG